MAIATFIFGGFHSTNRNGKTKKKKEKCLHFECFVQYIRSRVFMHLGRCMFAVGWEIRCLYRNQVWINMLLCDLSVLCYMLFMWHMRLPLSPCFPHILSLQNHCVSIEFDLYALNIYQRIK